MARSLHSGTRIPASRICAGRIRNHTYVNDPQCGGWRRRDVGFLFQRDVVCLATGAGPGYTIRIPNGIYMRDDEASTMKNYSRMLGLLNLSGIQRLTAIKLIEGVEVRVDEARNKAIVQYLTVVPFYNVVEEYHLDGKRTKNSRRDLQSGSMVCTACLKNDLPKESREGQNMVLRLDMYWDRPNPGALLEEMHVMEGGRELVVRSTVKVNAGTETARMVYHKIEGEYKPKYRWNPLEALRLMNSQ